MSLAPGVAAAQVPQFPPPPPAPSDRHFTVSLGPGVTTSLTHPPDWSTTLTLGLGWAIDERWTVSLGPYWEREIDHVEGETVSHDEISLAVGGSLAFADRWTLGLELDLGLVETFAGRWERNAEVGLGVGASWALPLGERWNLVLGPELSWKITDGEVTLGLNSGVSFDF